MKKYDSPFAILSPIQFGILAVLVTRSYTASDLMHLVSSESSHAVTISRPGIGKVIEGLLARRLIAVDIDLDHLTATNSTVYRITSSGIDRLEMAIQQYHRLSHIATVNLARRRHSQTFLLQ